MTLDRSVKHVVWVPFGRNDAKCVNRPEWWSHRTDVLCNVTLQSLYSQTWDGFEIWVAIMKDLEEKAQGMIEHLAERHTRVKIVIDPRDCPGKKKPYSPEPYEAICDHFEKDTETVVMTRIDSDDAFMPPALSIVRDGPCEEGTVGYFGGGWVMNPTRNLWAVYTPPKPMAYYSMAYGRRILEGRDTFENFRSQNGMDLFHHQLPRAKKAHNYGDGLILHHDCNENVVGSWERWKKRGHIGRPLNREEIKDLVDKTGINV